MDMPELVSIVLPVYNAEKYLSKAIDSCLNQTYSNIEIIAVNDGSTDSSLEILNSYGDKIRIITQENKGVSSAMNAGIREMKSNWYKLMNADDILYPNCVEILLNEIKKLKSQKVIVHGNYDIINSEGKKIAEIKKENYNKMDQFKRNVTLLDRDLINNPTILLHKNTFANYGFYDESIRAAVDYELWLRLCLKYNFKIHFVEDTLLQYRIHDESITANVIEKNPKYGDEVRKKVLQILDIDERKKYETELEIYRKQRYGTGIVKIKRAIKKNIRNLSFKKKNKRIDNISKQFRTEQS